MYFCFLKCFHASFFFRIVLFFGGGGDYILFLENVTFLNNLFCFSICLQDRSSVFASSHLMFCTLGATVPLSAADVGQQQTLAESGVSNSGDVFSSPYSGLLLDLANEGWEASFFFSFSGFTETLQVFFLVLRPISGRALKVVKMSQEKPQSLHFPQLTSVSHWQFQPLPH